jgi:D-alanyl-D-alanine carboxypeptidase/D-alanyl-D-alanine-endopeptidase (penicillin-binding protein 4)
MRSARIALVPILGVALLALAAAPAFAASGDAALGRTLKRYMRSAGSSSGAFVYNSTDRDSVLRLRHRTARTLASNTKLFTSSTALAQYGVAGTLPTEVRGVGQLAPDGTWSGDLYLKGGGDPTFGSSALKKLAVALKAAGFKRVEGSIVGDESRFDSRRGTAYSGFRANIDIEGPLSALSYNHGFDGRRFQSNPPVFAAGKLGSALKTRGVKVTGKPKAGVAPVDAATLASVNSPPMSTIVRTMNKPSDNWFAEMLDKDNGFVASHKGSTSAGVKAATRFARRLGSAVHLVDGSGLSRSDKASPYRVGRLLLSMQRRGEFTAFYNSLPIAGRDGTLSDRMRHGAAHNRCHAKTGSLSNVSALSGYCTARSGDVYVFSILMSRVHVSGARAIQDRMANAIAAIR